MLNLDGVISNHPTAPCLIVVTDNIIDRDSVRGSKIIAVVAFLYKVGIACTVGIRLGRIVRK